MTYIAKPKLHHPTLHPNKVGYTRRDYEGKVSTLCAGCGHDSISAAIIQACWELDIEPHRVAKLSGIGCSSKTPDYFLGASARLQHRARPHAQRADRRQPGQPRPAVPGRVGRRRLGLDRPRPVRPRHAARRAHGLHRREQRRLRPDQGPVLGHRRPGSKSKKGVVNNDSPVDLVGMALQLGATYVARGFSGDKAQLVPLIKGAIRHGGAAFIDVISPCVAFNNHAGSTKSYDYVREHNEAVSRIDFIDLARRDHRRAGARRGDRTAQPDGSAAAPAQAARRLRPHRPRAPP
jgi:2-oxoglutarate ferredoxin oxidoreductase subunit beta